MAHTVGMNHVAIVGASLAGLRASETLRAEGFNGDITVITAEEQTFYDRPPLSKKLLAGEWEPDRVASRKADNIDALQLTMRTGVAATGLDTVSRTLQLSDATTVSFDGLIIATGGVVRTLPNQPNIKGVHTLRTLSDSMALREQLVPGARLVVIGAGFIGLEVAATARTRGADVTVLEGLASPLIRALGAQMGAAVASVHERNGVIVRCGVQVQRIVGDISVTGVELGNGEIVAADVVLVGIGVAPATQWLETSSLVLRDGVVCDDTLNVGVPAIYAAGDVARWPNALFADVEPDMRVEHWTNAAEQGAVAAKNLLIVHAGEQPTPYAAVPFFWSDQFDSRVAFLGRARADSVVDVVAGDLDSRFCAIYSTNDRLTAVLGVSMPKLVMPARVLLQQSTSRSEALAHFRAALA